MRNGRSIRRAPAFVFVASLAATIAVGSRAFADLAPAFANVLTVDTQYVTSAPQATDIAFAGDGRAIVALKTGEILIRHANGAVTVVPYPFPGTLDTDSEKGLLGVVAAPNVAQNNSFFFYVSNGPTEDKHRIYRAVLTSSDTFIVGANPVLGAARGVGPGLEGPANHDGGGMIIHGGQLYVGVGDTGANSSPPTNKYASCLNKGNGKILRIALDGSVSSGNPLIGTTSVTGCDTPLGPWTTAPPDLRIFAWGVRNPWRFWIDPVTGLLWIGDVGEATQEEISVGGGNQHYGYPFVEGNQIWGDVDAMNCATLTPSRACTAPTYAYTHADGQAITGGLIPSGCGWSHVFASPNYVYGDSSAGWIHALPVNAARTGVASTTPVEVGTFSGQVPVSFRMGPDDALYVVMNAGAVYRLAPTDRTGEGCSAAVPASTGWTSGLLWLALSAAGVGLIASSQRCSRCFFQHGGQRHSSRTSPPGNFARARRQP
jgi:glucose/arabinose dehydrogenase